MNNPQMSPAQNMGDDTSRVFAGSFRFEATRQMYAETADLFANQIRKRFPDKSQTYVFADIGSFQGELTKEILEKLPDYHFTIIAIDNNEEALKKNGTAGKTILADAGKLPLETKSVDIAIMRYVLQWNPKEKQKQMLKELLRITKGCILIEHVGSAIEEPEKWRQQFDHLYDGSVIAKMKRSNYFFSSRDEIEVWMRELGMTFERINDRVIENGTDVYIERYALTDDESAQMRDLLGENNFFRQTDWVVFDSNR